MSEQIYLGTFMVDQIIAAPNGRPDTVVLDEGSLNTYELTDEKIATLRDVMLNANFVKVFVQPVETDDE